MLMKKKKEKDRYRKIVIFDRNIQRS